MKPEYKQWIDDWLLSHSSIAACSSATWDMMRTFPELRRVRGHYYCTIWGPREHWWLIATDGSVVDPTAEQFPSRGTGEYVELDYFRDTSLDPTGKCPNCGGTCYGGADFCDDDCANDFINDLNDEIRRYR
jgi:hypothetical protein